MSFSEMMEKSFSEVMEIISESDVMNAEAFEVIWNSITGTWTRIYTMLTAVNVAGIPLFWWFVTFAAISVLLVVVSNLSLGDASISSVLGFGKSESRSTKNYKNSDRSSKK